MASGLSQLSEKLMGKAKKHSGLVCLDLWSSHKIPEITIPDELTKVSNADLAGILNWVLTGQEYKILRQRYSLRVWDRETVSPPERAFIQDVLDALNFSSGKLCESFLTPINPITFRIISLNCPRLGFFGKHKERLELDGSPKLLRLSTPKPLEKWLKWMLARNFRPLSKFL